DDATNGNSVTGSDLIKVGLGQLALNGPSSFRGTTYAGTTGSTNAPVAEVQQVAINATTGTFTLSFNGSPPTGALCVNPPDVQVRQALEALPTIDPGDVLVSKTGSYYIVTFTGQLTGNQPQLAASGAGAIVSTLIDGTGINQFYGALSGVAGG